MDIYVYRTPEANMAVPHQYGWRCLLPSLPTESDIANLGNPPLSFALSPVRTVASKPLSDLLGSYGFRADWVHIRHPERLFMTPEAVRSEAEALLAVGVQKVLVSVSGFPSRMPPDTLSYLGPQIGISLLSGASDKQVFEWGKVAVDRGCHYHLQMLRRFDAIPTAIASCVTSVRLHGALWNTHDNASVVDHARRQLDVWAAPCPEAA